MSVYFASRTKHGARWRALRADGFPISATWIDESEQGQTDDWADLWLRCIQEVRACSALVFYAPIEDGHFKGALVEVGAALAFSRPVYFIGEGKVRGYSWLAHPLVTHCESLDDALALSLADHLRATQRGDDGR